MHWNPGEMAMTHPTNMLANMNPVGWYIIIWAVFLKEQRTVVSVRHLPTQSGGSVRLELTIEIYRSST